jgi:gamma-D-glutamyl-L-lysine dipeptidyl-peptidase
MRASLNRFNRAFAFILLVFAAPVLSAATQLAVVVKPVANMYSSPSTDVDVVSQAIYATNVNLLEERGEWTQVQTADDYKGWVATSDLRKVDAPYPSQGKVAWVSGMSANVYRDADVTKHAPLITVPFETKLQIASENVVEGERWMQVRLPDDRVGWIQRGDVSFEHKTLSIPEAIELAKKFMGVTYTWGGTSSFGYDCSGFMQMLMRQRGFVMPRDADIQAAWTGVAPVKREQLQAGDLLYFGSEKKITHTGMYIGDGMFIHDTTHGHPSVQISKLDDQPWTKLLIAARRAK